MKSSRVAGGDPAPSASLADPAGLPETPEDQDAGDVPAGIDEDALNQDEIDTDQVAKRN